MKVGIFDPYLDTLGGGEKYIFTIASCLKDHDVTIFWDNKEIVKEAQKRFNLDTSGIKIEKNIFNSPIYSKFLTRKYDIIFFLSDGSIPFLFAKKNFLIFQFPVNWVKLDSISRLKLSRISKVICYSDFVKEHIDKTFIVDSIVLPPAINTKPSSIKKENIILSVGRFTKGMNTKKQEFLIDVFNKNSEAFKGWKLILAGSCLDRDLDYAQELKEMTKNKNIEIEVNIGFEELMKLYSQAKIYWHAAGFGEDLESSPEKAEHFGISTVEAMSIGAVPVVINEGGQKEIVDNGRNGLLWNSEKELIDQTEKLIKDEDLLEKLSEEAIIKSKDFSYENFCQKLQALL